MSTMEPVKIYPGTNLSKDLPAKQCLATLAWFRSNGVNPNGVSADDLVVIDAHQIDFWWVTTPDTPEPEGSHVMERWAEADSFPRSHHQKPVTVPLPDEVESALRALQAGRDNQEAELRTRLDRVHAPCPNCGE